MLPGTVTFAVREDGTIDLDAPGGTAQEVRPRMGDRFLKGSDKEIMRSYSMALNPIAYAEDVNKHFFRYQIT